MLGESHVRSETGPGRVRLIGSACAAALSRGVFWERFLLPERSRADRYTAAALFVAAALVLAHYFNRIEGAQLSSVSFTAVVLAAIYGGTGPALMAAGASAVAFDYFFADPVMQVFDSWASWVRVATYACVGFLVANIVSSLRDAYRRLHAAHRRTEEEKQARQNTLAIVSHDLRSPLAAVLMGLGDVKRRLVDRRSGDCIVKDLDAMRRSAERMRRLVDDLLDAGKMESGTFRIKRAMHRAADIVEDALESNRFVADVKGVRLEADIGGDAMVHCDRERMTQVLCNLLGNAIKFSPAGEAVSVAATWNRDGWRVDITDHGPGIAEASKPNLFLRYWQAADSAHLGTGLGLFIAHSIVDAHGGRIEVCSAAGGGSTFSVFLPQ